jgi:hypothetical protein
MTNDEITLVAFLRIGDARWPRACSRIARASRSTQALCTPSDRHDLCRRLRSRAKPRRCLDHLPVLAEQVAAAIGGLDLVADPTV